MRKATPLERDDYLIEETPIPEGWNLDADEPMYIPETDDEDHLENLIREMAYVLRHIGGTVTIGADRHEIGSGVWRNRGFGVSWNSYAPGRRSEGKDDRKQENGQGSRSGRRGRRRERDVARETREQRPTVPEAPSPDVEPEQEDLEPDGGTVVDESVVDPGNADIRPDVANSPGDVLAGNA